MILVYFSHKIIIFVIEGIILVHDLTNRKSQQNLTKWLTEILNRDAKGIMEE